MVVMLFFGQIKMAKIPIAVFFYGEIRTSPLMVVMFGLEGDRVVLLGKA
jgi:hypothetical protein